MCTAQLMGRFIRAMHIWNASKQWKLWAARSDLWMIDGFTSTAVICVLLTLPEFHLFCEHKELKEIEFCQSSKITSNCTLIYFLFQRADTVDIVGWLNFTDGRLLAMKRNITVLFHCEFLFCENIFVSFISDVILFPHQMSRKQALIMHIFSVLECREPAQCLNNITCRILY